jgi:hypothetical protein
VSEDVLEKYTGLMEADHAFFRYDETGQWLELFEALAAEVRALRGVVAQVQEFTDGGLYEDGGHHKQWYLEQIANVVGFKPSDDYPWEEGIAP